MRLLVFDDERGMLAFIGTVARDRGWAVDGAATEAEFHALFAANRPGTSPRPPPPSMS